MSFRVRPWLLLGFLAGCTVYNGSLLPDGGQSQDAPDNVIHPPTRPSIPDQPGSVVLTYALDTIDFTQGGDALQLPDENPDPNALWRVTGYDLDGYDTVYGEQQGHCTPPPFDPDMDGPLPFGSRFPVDGELGRDNVMGRSLLPLLFQTGALPTLECDLNEGFRQGQGTLLIMVSAWNGACDPSVRAEVHVATDGTSLAPSVLDGRNPANWNGPNLWYLGDHADPPNPDRTDGMLDTFFADPSGYVDSIPTNPAEIVDSNAFIVCGADMVPTLVVHLDGVPFNIYLGNRGVIAFLNDATMVLKLSADYSRIVDGVISGRFPVGRLEDVGKYVGVCGPFRATLNDQFRILADVLDHEEDDDDEPGMDRECNAVSLGLPFQGHRVFFGGPAPGEVGNPLAHSRPLANACDPDGNGDEEDGNAIPGFVAGYGCCDVATCMPNLGCCCDAGCETRMGCVPCYP